MDFLRPLFEEEIDGEGEIIIAGSPFERSRILRELEPQDYDQAFRDWCEQRRERLLERADELLAMYNNRERFNRLKDAYRHGTVTPFVGAGLSMPSGYPGWTRFLRHLRAESHVSEADFETLISAGEYEEAAQRLFDDSERLFNAGLKDHFAQDRDIVGPVQYLPLMFNGAALTTNFDSVLKRVYDANGRSFDLEMFGDDSDEFAELLGRGKRVLLRLHGHCELVKHRVITRAEYDAAYDAAKLNHLVRDVLFRKPLLFLGCSLAYDRVQKAMSDVVTVSKSGELVTHYAFAALKGSDDRVARLKTLAGANIFPIWYPEGQHDEAIEALLLKLADGVMEIV